MARIVTEKFEAGDSLSPAKEIPSERVVHLFKVAMEIVALLEKEKVIGCERTFVMEQIKMILSLKEGTVIAPWFNQ